MKTIAEILQSVTTVDVYNTMVSDLQTFKLDTLVEIATQEATIVAATALKASAVEELRRVEVLLEQLVSLPPKV